MLQMRDSDKEVIAGTFGRGIFSSDGFAPNNTALDDLKNENKIEVFPNPVVDQLSIRINNTSAKKGSMSIFSMQGKEVYRKNVETGNMMEETISIGNLPKGQYLVKINLGSQTYSKSISKT